jgi:hypothetical protein
MLPNTLHLSISQGERIIRIFRLGWRHKMEKLSVELVLNRRRGS